MDDAIRCDVGACPEPATQLILARAGENMVGNGMAVWTTYFRCGGEHRADEDSRRIRQVDPDGQVMVFLSREPLTANAVLLAHPAVR